MKFGTRDGNIMLLSTFEFLIIGVGQVTAALHSKNIKLIFVIVSPHQKQSLWKYCG
jgi:flagellar motor component MotA